MLPSPTGSGTGGRRASRAARWAPSKPGVSLFRIHPGRPSPFAHRHTTAEEVYVILAGDGRVKLDDEVLPVRRLDAIRVAPGVMRAFEAGPGRP